MMGVAVDGVAIFEVMEALEIGVGARGVLERDNGAGPETSVVAGWLDASSVAKG